MLHGPSVSCKYSGIVECAVVGAIISRGWDSSARTDTHLNYMIDIALTTEFSLAAGGAR
jgi:hypothetical protein